MDELKQALAASLPNQGESTSRRRANSPQSRPSTSSEPMGVAAHSKRARTSESGPSRQASGRDSPRASEASLSRVTDRRTQVRL